VDKWNNLPDEILKDVKSKGPLENAEEDLPIGEWERGTDMRPLRSQIMFIRNITGGEQWTRSQVKLRM
jgi:hypothetical protein